MSPTHMGHSKLFPLLFWNFPLQQWKTWFFHLRNNFNSSTCTYLALLELLTRVLCKTLSTGMQCSCTVPLTIHYLTHFLVYLGRNLSLIPSKKWFHTFLIKLDSFIPISVPFINFIFQKFAYAEVHFLCIIFSGCDNFSVIHHRE